MTQLLLRLFVKNHQDTQSPAVREGYGKLAGLTGIVVNALLCAGKLLAGALSGSVSIMADAINNLSDAASSIVTLLGFKLAAKPADDAHPYGHQRVEYLAGLTVAAANIVGFVKQGIDVCGSEGTEEILKRAREQPIVKSSPGLFQRLLPGESFEGFSPSRPNANLDPFMRYMLREVAAGVGVSYEALSRDYSQSNYSSSRLALLNERDLWRVLQGWLIRNYLTPIYRRWLDAAVLSGAVDIPDYFNNKARYQEVRFKPRGWSWVDPAKEVQAYALAVQHGFMSRSDVIAAIGNGQDREDVDKAIQSDRERAAELGLSFDQPVKIKPEEEKKEKADE